MHIARRCLLLGALATPTFLSSCFRGKVHEEFLEVLRSDELADVDLLGLTLTNAEESGYENTLGKPSYAEVRHRFALGDAEAEQVLADAVAAAEAAGWRADGPVNEALLAWGGSKDEPPRICSLSINDQRDQLSVRLINRETP
ncbi:MAG: hypothetical protein GX596_05575 [Propionibacterium sp.]|nr:hypothetical protein [Propionibacterium sp.]